MAGMALVIAAVASQPGDGALSSAVNPFSRTMR
jgi:hypothetical protein